MTTTKKMRSKLVLTKGLIVPSTFVDLSLRFGERERKRADLNVLLATAEGLRESREAGTSEG